MSKYGLNIYSIIFCVCTTQLTHCDRSKFFSAKKFLLTNDQITWNEQAKIGHWHLAKCLVVKSTINTFGAWTFPQFLYINHSDGSIIPYCSSHLIQPSDFFLFVCLFRCCTLLVCCSCLSISMCIYEKQLLWAKLSDLCKFTVNI